MKYRNTAFGYAMVLGCGVTASQAATVSLEVLDHGNAAFTSAQIDGNQVEPLGNNQFEAGSFQMQDTNTLDQFLAWCVEIEVLVEFNATSYDVQSAYLSPERNTLVSKLFTGYFGETGTNAGAAAFQLAIWEIVEETSSDIADLNLTTGRFTAASTTAEVVDKANGFLSGLGGFDANYKVTYFESGTSQDLVTAAPVPLPAGLLFLGTALGAIGACRRQGLKRRFQV